MYHRFFTNWYVSGQVCAASVEHFKGCMNRQSNVDVSVYQGEVLQRSCGTLQFFFFVYESYEIYTLLCNTEGDTVILSKNTGVIAVYEVAVTMTGMVLCNLCYFVVKRGKKSNLSIFSESNIYSTVMIEKQMFLVQLLF